MAATKKRCEARRGKLGADGLRSELARQQSIESVEKGKNEEKRWPRNRREREGG